MPAVVHRSMQRHGATGSQVPIRLRTCPNCQIVFKSKTGLLQHQSRKKNVGCFRAGILRLRHNWIKKRNDYHSTWRKKQVPEVHVSVREVCPKIQLWFPEKIFAFFGVKNSRKCCGFGLFSCWQLWFHEKNLGEKLVKMLRFCQNWIFGQKFDFSNSVILMQNSLLVETYESEWKFTT